LDNVSLLDLRLFICKQQNSILQVGQRKKLEKFVIETIEAKELDVVLCMGKVYKLKPVPNVFLESRPANNLKKEPKSMLCDRPCRFSDKFWKRVEWINTIHPSYSINYYPEYTSKHLELLSSILKTCHRQRLKDSGLCPTNKARSGPVEIVAKLARSPSYIKWVQILLWVMSELCLQPRSQLPAASLKAGCSYPLEHQHEDAQVLEYSGMTSDLDKNTAAALMPLFKRLNKFLKYTGWDLQAYEADLEVESMLADGLAIFQGAYDSLDEDRSFNCKEEEKEESDNTCNTIDVLSCREDITVCITAPVPPKPGGE
jgi:hypothetical protein